jgi:hypothetical protein
MIAALIASSASTEKKIMMKNLDSQEIVKLT